MALYKLTFFYAQFISTVAALSVFTMVLAPLLSLFSYVAWGHPGGLLPIYIVAFLHIAFTAIFVGIVAHALLGAFFFYLLVPNYVPTGRVPM